MKIIVYIHDTIDVHITFDRFLNVYRGKLAADIDMSCLGFLLTVRFTIPYF